MAKIKRIAGATNKVRLSNAISLANKTIAACHLCTLEYKAGNKAEAKEMAFRALLLLSQDANALDKPRRVKRRD